MKTKMDISTGYKKGTNLQAEWPRMSMINKKVRIRMISKLELQKGTTATHRLESQGQT